jgi:hypothetical protein
MPLAHSSFETILVRDHPARSCACRHDQPVAKTYFDVVQGIKSSITMASASSKWVSDEDMSYGSFETCLV